MNFNKFSKSKKDIMCSSEIKFLIKAGYLI